MNKSREKKVGEELYLQNQNNVMLAQFCGFDYTPSNDMYYCCIDHCDQEMSGKELRFHESWDWLMVAIKECWKVANLHQVDFASMIAEFRFDHITYGDLNESYEAVCEFVNHFNADGYQKHYVLRTIEKSTMEIVNPNGNIVRKANLHIVERKGYDQVFYIHIDADTNEVIGVNFHWDYNITDDEFKISNPTLMYFYNRILRTIEVSKDEVVKGITQWDCLCEAIDVYWDSLQRCDESYDNLLKKNTK